MIFAAGLGTRLKPLTDSMPKALVPVAGVPLLQHVILKLAHAGFNQIVINVHHFPDMIIDFLRKNDNFGLSVSVSDERNLLLDTGGGIRKASSFFDDGQPFLVHNVDILSNVDLAAFYQYHLQHKADVTLLTSWRQTQRYLLFDKETLQLHGWENTATGQTKSPYPDFNPAAYRQLAFSGIHVISPSVFPLMQSYPEVFPIMDFYLQQCRQLNIVAYPDKDLQMVDVGKLFALDQAEQFVQTHPNV